MGKKNESERTEYKNSSDERKKEEKKMRVLNILLFVAVCQRRMLCQNWHRLKMY
jgi:hypothetical protein